MGLVITVWRVLVVREIYVDFLSNFNNAEAIKSQLAASLGGKPLLFLSEKDTTNQLQKKFPEVSNVSIVKNWPTGVTAQVESWSETLIVGEKAPFFLVNNQGLIFGNTNSKDSGIYLPLQIPEGLSAGQNINCPNLNSLVTTNNFMVSKEAPYQFTDIQAGSVSMTVGKTLVLLPLDQHMTSVLDTFWRIYKSYQISAKAVKTIDVRFDNPVITE